jgi:hypothetical protein
VRRGRKAIGPLFEVAGLPNSEQGGGQILRTCNRWGAVAACAIAGLALALATLALGFPSRALPLSSTANTLQFGCKYNATKTVDPFVDPNHKHDFYGSKPVFENTTHRDLLRNEATSCNVRSTHAAFWNPQAREGGNEVQTPRSISVYYQDLNREDARMQLHPQGAKMIATEENGQVHYRCGGQASRIVKEVPYGCKEETYRVVLTFPNCWSGSGVGPQQFKFVNPDTGKVDCRGAYPIRLPDLRMAIHYRNEDRRLERPLEFSAGGGHWESASFVHADRFGADTEAFRRLERRCFLNKPHNAPTPRECDQL